MFENLSYLFYIHSHLISLREMGAPASHGEARSHWRACDVDSLRQVTAWYVSRHDVCLKLSQRLQDICRAFGAVIMFFFEDTRLEKQAYAAIALNHRVLLDLPKEKYQPERAQAIVKAVNTLSLSGACFDMKQYRNSVTASRTARTNLVQSECLPLYFFIMMSPESMRIKSDVLQDIRGWAIQCNSWTDWMCAPTEHRMIICDRDLCTTHGIWWNITYDDVMIGDRFIRGYSRYLLSVLMRHGTRSNINEMLEVERSYASQAVDFASQTPII